MQCNVTFQVTESNAGNAEVMETPNVRIHLTTPPSPSQIASQKLRKNICQDWKLQCAEKLDKKVRILSKEKSEKQEAIENRLTKTFVKGKPMKAIITTIYEKYLQFIFN